MQTIRPLLCFFVNNFYLCCVRKYIVILLMSIHLLTSTELHQLLKLHEFVSHYFEHQTQNPELNLLEFIQLHYFSGNVHDEDYAEDMKLPFKQTCIEHTLVYIPIIHQVTIAEHTEIPLKKPMFYQEDKQFTAYLSDIWNPPRG